MGTNNAFYIFALSFMAFEFSFKTLKVARLSKVMNNSRQQKKPLRKTDSHTFPFPYEMRYWVSIDAEEVE